ncbi:Hypothetical Protein SLY_0901 [Strawberry lethal yellows phytoplasma (CPA) str. NZSb11]|uniref:Uncharacterized protein n=1 Tax=Strawberry lethal yellows phytoplasma (CPA) str. NZSb11 TaxID=980422 RepID=R4RQM8_PHYAS|nr:Hypothetical Protein SLY_0901 [Strawberry lethal yellows phytoplasma (CPA) str. NZSb11]
MNDDRKKIIFQLLLFKLIQKIFVEIKRVFYKTSKKTAFKKIYFS